MCNKERLEEEEEGRRGERREEGSHSEGAACSAGTH